MELIEADIQLVDSSKGQCAVKRETVFDQDFLDGLQSERFAKTHVRAAEQDRVASVPAQLVDVWIAQGRDFWNAKPSEILKWLREDNLEAFITTPKRV